VDVFRLPVLASAAGALGATYCPPYIAVDGSYHPRPTGQTSALPAPRSGAELCVSFAKMVSFLLGEMSRGVSDKDFQFPTLVICLCISIEQKLNLFGFDTFPTAAAYALPNLLMASEKNTFFAYRIPHTILNFLAFLCQLKLNFGHSKSCFFS